MDLWFEKKKRSLFYFIFLVVFYSHFPTAIDVQEPLASRGLENVTFSPRFKEEVTACLWDSVVLENIDQFITIH